jgi:hypothetical protein
MTGTKTLWSRGVMLTLVGALVLPGVACDAIDDLMSVRDPERIQEETLEDEKLANTLVASAVGDFQVAYDDPFIWVGQMLTDEMVTGINWEDYARVNERLVLYNEGPADAMFSELSGARYTSELAYDKLVGMESPKVTGDMLATTLAYAGYSYILLGDAMCEATVDEGADLYTPEQLYGFAIERFTEALSQATDADLQNLARVGLARAHLNRLEYSQAMSFASAVPTDFVWWSEYVDDTRADNALYGEVHGANHTMGVHPRFLNGGWDYWEDPVPDALQTDPRIQHMPDWDAGHNGFSPLYKPFQSLPYSGFTGNTIAAGAELDDEDGVDLYQRATDIKVASYLEAQHHYYEAGLQSGSLTDAEVETFVNARRAFGNQAPVSGLTHAELIAELREQRARDNFFGGFRLGDLRRYAKQGAGPAHSFPTGQHPVVSWGDYNTATCFPLPLEEYQGNPNISDPNI